MSITNRLVVAIIVEQVKNASESSVKVAAPQNENAPVEKQDDKLRSKIGRFRELKRELHSPELSEWMPKTPKGTLIDWKIGIFAIALNVIRICFFL